MVSDITYDSFHRPRLRLIVKSLQVSHDKYTLRTYFEHRVKIRFLWMFNHVVRETRGEWSVHCDKQFRTTCRRIGHCNLHHLPNYKHIHTHTRTVFYSPNSPFLLHSSVPNLFANNLLVWSRVKIKWYNIEIEVQLKKKPRVTRPTTQCHVITRIILCIRWNEQNSFYSKQLSIERRKVKQIGSIDIME